MSELLQENIGKRILYEDRSILVLHKPAGIAVQDARSRVMDLECMIRNELVMRERALGRETIPYLGIVHRLDLPVEGIVVFAKTRKAASILSTQIQQGKMRKEYLAVCAMQRKFDDKKETAQESSGTLTDHLLKDGRTNSSSVVKKGTPGAKEAVLSYKILEKKEEKCLLRIDLKTGRHHQIRVQLSHAGMPILGDKKYGWIPSSGDLQEEGLALCAHHLSFFHPEDGSRKTFQIEPENGWFRNFGFVSHKKQ